LSEITIEEPRFRQGMHVYVSSARASGQYLGMVDDPHCYDPTLIGQDHVVLFYPNTGVGYRLENIERELGIPPVLFEELLRDYFRRENAKPEDVDMRHLRFIATHADDLKPGFSPGPPMQ